MLDSLNINLLIFKEACTSNSAHVSINGKSLGKMYFCQALLLFRTTKLECLNNYIHISITTQAIKIGFPLTIGFSMAKVKEKFAQLCPTLRPHGLHSPWNSPGQNTGVGSLSLLQGIFPTQGLNPGLPHCRQILYQLSHTNTP